MANILRSRRGARASIPRAGVKLFLDILFYIAFQLFDEVYPHLPWL